MSNAPGGEKLTQAAEYAVRPAHRVLLIPHKVTYLKAAPSMAVEGY